MADNGAGIKKLKDFKPLERNPNLHTPHGLGLLEKSIGKYGYITPMTAAADGTILDGNARLEKVVTQLPEDPIIIHHDGKRPIIAIRDDIKDGNSKQAREIAVMANRTAEVDLAWDINELQTMKVEGVDLLDLGFSDIDLNKLGFENEGENQDAEAQIDKAEELNKKWKVKKGDLWRLGEHKIICGDCTVVTDVERLMGKEKAVLMNTDPPYGVNYGDLVKSRENKSKYEDIKNDDLTAEKLQAFLESCIKTAVPFLIENPAFYLWHPMLTQGTFFAAAADILIHRQIIWVKPSLILGRGDYHWRHELCFYGWYKGHRPAWYAGRDQDTVWEVGKENDNIHPTQKPLELFVRPIKNHSKEGEIIYEPFSGSGSQIIAAENTKRKCYAVEIEPNYVAVALQRWADLTNKEPERINDKKMPDFIL